MEKLLILTNIIYSFSFVVANWNIRIRIVQIIVISTGISIFIIDCLNSRELVEQDITLKNGDVLSVGQTELKITIIKNNQAN